MATACMRDIQNVTAYDARRKGWMARFRGVAARYLDSSLGRFQVIDRTRGAGPQPP